MALNEGPRRPHAAKRVVKRAAPVTGVSMSLSGDRLNTVVTFSSTSISLKTFDMPVECEGRYSLINVYSTA